MPSPDELEDQNLLDDAADDADDQDLGNADDVDDADDQDDDEPDDGDSDATDDGAGEPPARSARRASRDADDADDEDPKERELAELKTRLAQLERAGSQPSAEDIRRADAEEREYVNSLPPDEKRAYLQDKQMRGLANEIERLKLSNADAVDKAVYESKAASNPLYAKHASLVETKLAETRRMGFTVPREKILAVIIGEQVLRSGASVKRQQDKGRKDVRDNRGRNGAGRGDASGRQQTNGKTAEDRLSGQLI